MTALSNRYVTLQKESAYGVQPIATTATLFLGEVDDESFSQNFDLLTRADISRYGASKTVAGLFYGEGDVNLPLQLDDFNSFCLFSAFGVDGFDSATTPNTHTLTETLDDATFPSFTARIGMETLEHTYPGMVLNSLSLSANVNEYVMMTYSFVGCGETAVGTLTVPGAAASDSPPAFGTLDALHFAKAYVSFESLATNSNFSKLVKSVSLEITLNRDTDNASALGKNTYMVSPPPQLREITGSLELNTGNDITGAEGDNTPTYEELRGFLLHNGTDALPALMLRFEDAATPTPNFFEIKIPKVAYEAPEMSLSGRDTTTLSMNFVGLFDETAGYMAKAVIGMDGINGDAAMTKTP